MHEKEAAIGYCGCCNYAAKLTGQRLVGIPDENGTTFKPSQPIRMALPNSLIRAKNRSDILIEINGQPRRCLEYSNQNFRKLWNNGLWFILELRVSPTRSAADRTAGYKVMSACRYTHALKRCRGFLEI